MLFHHPHPTAVELETFLRDASRLGAAGTNTRIVQHLLGGCPTCRQRLDDLGWEMSRLERLLLLRPSAFEDEASAASGGYDYSQAFAGAERALAAFFAQGRPAQASADELWTELSSLSAEEQVRLIESDRRFVNPQLVKLLLEGSRALRYQDPERILHLAHIACLIAESCTVDECGSPERLADLRCQGWRQYGNALRVQGRLREAEAAFGRAQRFCEEGTGDPPLRARLLAQKASLRMFQRRLDEAVQLTDEAGRIYRELGQTGSLASTMIQKAVACIYASEPEEAVRALNRAIPLIAPEEDPHLLLVACHNLVRCYIDLGRPEQALSLYYEIRGLYREFHDALILLRAYWQEGQILRDLGHLGAAEAALIRAREGFCQHELPLEAALVSLHLAEVYVKLGDLEKLEEIVATTVPIFQMVGVDREALASLLQLRQLAENRRQASELIQILYSRVEHYGHGDPS
jgi:tetratricopeptide (TPR) repeat protein